MPSLADASRGATLACTYGTDANRANLRQDLDIRIIDAATGELLRQLTLDPSRNYQPTGRPPGPPPGTPRKNRHPEP
jgi:hypothetical protein